MGDDNDVFATFDGSSPTTDWVCGRIKSLAKLIIPVRLAMIMDYTNHCLRRGGALANDVNEVPVVVQERSGGWAPGSSSRPLYIARIMERQARAQYDMVDTPHVTIMQNDVGVSDLDARNPHTISTTARPTWTTRMTTTTGFLSLANCWQTC